MRTIIKIVWRERKCNLPGKRPFYYLDCGHYKKPNWSTIVIKNKTKARCYECVKENKNEK